MREIFKYYTILKMRERLPTFVHELPTWTQNLKRKIQIKGASAYLQYWGKDHQLQPEGKENWERFLWKIENRQITTLSDEIGIVNGFNYYVEGMDNLENIDTDRGFLVIANHSNEGPVRGWGQVIVMNHAVKKTTGEEIVWAQGGAASGTSAVAGESVRTIKVNSGSGIGGAKNVLQSLKTEAVGIFAEGTQERDLQRGDYRTGKIMARAAKHNIPVICIATSYVNGEIYVTADALDSSKIQRLEQIQQENVNPYQVIVDYAMTTIASHLPQDRRGYYEDKIPLSTPLAA